MANEALHREIQVLERRVHLLLSEFERVQNELKKKEVENARLKANLEAQQDNLKDFQNKYNLSKIVSSKIGEKDEAEEFRKLLDHYIKEIDKCIAHLGEA